MIDPFDGEAAVVDRLACRIEQIVTQTDGIGVSGQAVRQDLVVQSEQNDLQTACEPRFDRDLESDALDEASKYGSHQSGHTFQVVESELKVERLMASAS